MINDLNRKIEVRADVWKNIEKQLPKKNYRFIWWFSGSAIVFAALGIFAFVHLNHAPTFVKNNDAIKEQQKTSNKKNKGLMEFKDKTEPASNIAGEKIAQISADQLIKNTNSEIQKTSSVNKNYSQKNSNSPNNNLPIESQNEMNNSQGNAANKNALNSSNFNENKNSTSINKQIVQAIAVTKTINADTMIEESEKNVGSKNNNGDKPQNNIAINPFFALQYGINKTKLQLSPALMDLPFGNTNSFQIKFGSQMNRFQFDINSGVSFAKQMSVMPGKYNPLYKHIMDPNYKSMVPKEYRNEFLDSQKLVIPGTNRNEITQKYTMLNVGINVSYQLINYKKVAVSAGVGVNYSRIINANTFFWDSVNNVAVTFSQKHTLIVIPNQFSNTFLLNFTYGVGNKTQFYFEPYIQKFYTPFLKHYYSAYFRNYGIMVGVKWVL